MLTKQIKISIGAGIGRVPAAVRTNPLLLGFLRLTKFRFFFTLALLTAVVALTSSEKARSHEQILDYKNPRLSVERRVADLLSRMTLEEKIAQMTCLWINRPQKNAQTDFTSDRGDFSPEKATQVMKYGIGQIARQREQKGPRDGAIFANAVQKWLIENTRLGIPAVFHDEILHGHMARKH